jgi:hypothetical protein
MFSFNRLPKRNSRKEIGLVVFNHDGWLNSAMRTDAIALALGVSIGPVRSSPDAKTGIGYS